MKKKKKTPLYSLILGQNFVSKRKLEIYEYVKLLSVISKLSVFAYIPPRGHPTSRQFPRFRTDVY